MERSELATGANPYWDEVAPGVMSGQYDGRQVGDFNGNSNWLVKRRDLVSRYAWTITAPDTVTFVAEHAGPRLLDPMAGTGYWAALLGQRGVDVAAYDANRPGPDNGWHHGASTWIPVRSGQAIDVAATHTDRTLLLAWPPYSTPDGAKTLAAYRGNRVIYIGENEGGCCGDDDMFDLFDRGWRPIAEHSPVQWVGIHDYITVYERKED